MGKRLLEIKSSEEQEEYKMEDEVEESENDDETVDYSSSDELRRTKERLLSRIVSGQRKGVPSNTLYYLADGCGLELLGGEEVP